MPFSGVMSVTPACVYRQQLQGPGTALGGTTANGGSNTASAACDLPRATQQQQSRRQHNRPALSLRS
jgi:hypothetical protein